MNIVQVRAELMKWFNSYNEARGVDDLFKRLQINKDFNKLCAIYLLDPDEEWLNCSCEYWFGPRAFCV